MLGLQGFVYRYSCFGAFRGGDYYELHIACGIPGYIQSRYVGIAFQVRPYRSLMSEHAAQFHR